MEKSDTFISSGLAVENSGLFILHRRRDITMGSWIFASLHLKKKCYIEQDRHSLHMQA